MFKKFWIDVILGGVFILLIMLLFHSLIVFKIFSVLDPIGEAFSDMEFTDLYYSQLLDEHTAEENIILVNVGLEDRLSIARMIDSINQHKPAVIGLNLFFDHLSEDTVADIALASAFNRVENLVLISKVFKNGSDPNVYDFDKRSHPLFSYSAEYAYMNLFTPSSSKVCREFYPTLKMSDGNMQTAFSVKLASYLFPEKTHAFLERKNTTEVINYKGNILDFESNELKAQYYALDINDIYKRNYLPEFIKGKIVIFCFLGKYIGDKTNIENKYFTPLNESYIGKGYPDMFAGVIHANIISMIINGDYIHQMNDFETFFISLIFFIANLALFVWIYKTIPRWYDGITKSIQAFELIGLPWLMVYALNFYNIKIDLTLLLFAIAVSGDALEIYFGVIKNSFSKKGRKELFKIKKLYNN